MSEDITRKAPAGRERKKPNPAPSGRQAIEAPKADIVNRKLKTWGRSTSDRYGMLSSSWRQEYSLSLKKAVLIGYRGDLVDKVLINIGDFIEYSNERPIGEKA